MPVIAGIHVTVVREWTAEAGALFEVVNSGRLAESRLKVLHPPIGSSIYVLAVFRGKDIQYVAASHVYRNSTQSDSSIGLIPLHCIAVGGQCHNTGVTVDVALNEHGLPFRIYMGIGTEHAARIEGVINASAIDFWLTTDHQPRIYLSTECEQSRRL